MTKPTALDLASMLHELLEDIPDKVELSYTTAGDTIRKAYEMLAEFDGANEGEDQ